MEEWAHLPLRDWPDMERWFAAMSDQFVIEQTQHAPGASPGEPIGGGFAMPISPSPRGSTHSPRGEMEANEPSAAYTWPVQGDPSMGSPYGTHLHPQAIISSPVYPRGPATGGSDGVASPVGAMAEYASGNVGIVANESGQGRPTEGGLSNRAEELSRSKPSLYF
ncbi:hypothetical protein N7462_009030 [Penicillium macrosclerotiorum]|uniref:uncharacterized protein n=1 Tax=Penicillium macrosclerotiorum TaxID=303699 RepID=UPI00254769F2|nr:uncharacterized protein N7462_009030 [Penicillium macrosclerotiorum]KAJ5676133.1 hypothetical protein N7462_009030 [Penicillium macrosclerotiorum]